MFTPISPFYYLRHTLGRTRTDPFSFLTSTAKVTLYQTPWIQQVPAHVRRTITTATSPILIPMTAQAQKLTEAYQTINAKDREQTMDCSQQKLICAKRKRRR